MILTYVTIGLFIISVGVLIALPFFRRKQDLLNIVYSSEKNYNFIYFLLYNNIFNDFITNLEKQKNIKLLSLWIKHTSNIYYITEAFNWFETKQGYSFWYSVNKQWISIFKHRKSNLKEILYLIKKRNL